MTKIDSCRATDASLADWQAHLADGQLTPQAIRARVRAAESFVAFAAFRERAYRLGWMKLTGLFECRRAHAASSERRPKY